MQNAKLLGHPVHPMLVVFPLGLLITAVLFDIVYLFSGNALFAHVAYWNIAVGIIGGLTAGIFGLIDWVAIPRGTRAKTIGFWHGLGNVVLIGLFVWSWLIRSDAVDYAPSTNAFALGFAGVLLGAITGWLGGELVDRLGVGVDQGAHVNAPISLSGRPAR